MRNEERLSQKGQSLFSWHPAGMPFYFEIMLPSRLNPKALKGLNPANGVIFTLYQNKIP
jgi:hypothetical protein